MSGIKSLIITLVILLSPQLSQGAMTTPFQVPSGLTGLVAGLTALRTAPSKIWSSWTTPQVSGGKHQQAVAKETEMSVVSPTAAHNPAKLFAAMTGIDGSAQHLKAAAAATARATQSSPLAAPAAKQRQAQAAPPAKSARMAATAARGALHTPSVVAPAQKQRVAAKRVQVDRTPTPETAQLFKAFAWLQASQTTTEKHYYLNEIRVLFRSINDRRTFNVHAYDLNGNTLAHIAAFCNMPRVVKVLKSQGANIRLHNFQGISPNRFLQRHSIIESLDPEVRERIVAQHKLQAIKDSILKALAKGKKKTEIVKTITTEFRGLQ